VRRNSIKNNTLQNSFAKPFAFPIVFPFTLSPLISLGAVSNGKACFVKILGLGVDTSL